MAAATDEVACAEGNESFVGALREGRVLLEQRALAADRELDDEVDAHGERADGAGEQPLVAPASIDRRADDAGGGPDRAVLAGHAERPHRHLDRLLVAAGAEQPQDRLVGVGEGGKHGVAPPADDQRAHSRAGPAPAAWP